VSVTPTSASTPAVRLAHRLVRPDRPLRAALALLLAVVGVAAGCGGGSGSQGVASVGASTSTTSSSTSQSAENEMAQLVRYSACMRSHGLPNFPDPDASGSIRLKAGSGSGPDSTQYESANQACKSLLPNGGVQSPAEQAQRRASLLAFAACMRKHGIPNFPDPDSQGQFPSSIAQILRNKAQFRAAENACPQR
jgi:hypothetical protein